MRGWGGTCLSHLVGGEWPTPPTAHINVLEIAAVRKVLLHFFHLVRGRHVLIRTDRVSHPDIVRLIWRRFRTAQVDLFTSKKNTHCRWWFSLNPQDLPPLGVDALAHAP